MVSLLLLRLIVLKKEVSRKHIYCIAKSWGFLRAGGPQKKSGCIQYGCIQIYKQKCNSSSIFRASFTEDSSSESFN